MLRLPLHIYSHRTSLVSQKAKNLPRMQDICFQFLGKEDPLEKGRATHSSILAWRIPWTEEPGRLQFMGSQRIRHDWKNNTFIFIYSLGLPRWLSGKQPSHQGKSRRRLKFHSWVRKIPWRMKWQPTPASLPGESRDRGGWQATVFGVTKSWTPLSNWAHTLVY